VRVLVRCPSCGHASRFLLVDDEVCARCVKCGTVFEPRCAACGLRPGSEALTGVDAPRCAGCEAPLALEAGPVVAPYAKPGGAVDWGDLRLELRFDGAPYRDGRPSRLSLHAPPRSPKQRLAAWGALAAPGLIALPFDAPLFAAVWASLAGVVVSSGTRSVALEVDPTHIRILRRGWTRRPRTLRAQSVREVWWAGRGGDCAVWARSDAGAVVLFDGLSPRRARALAAHVGVVIGLDVDDRRR